MSWLLEDPTTVITLGLIVGAVLLVMLFQTRRGIFLISMIGTAAVVGLLVLLEWYVVTDVEQVENTVDVMARALEDPNREAGLNVLLSHIAPNSFMLQTRARLAMSPAFSIREVKTSDLQITMNRVVSPPSATVELVANVEGTAAGAAFDRYIQRFVLHFRQLEEDGPWLLYDYETLSLTGDRQ